MGAVRPRCGARHKNAARLLLLMLPSTRPGGMIYLLRHGETAWNAAGRFQGRQDTPLTSRGIEQSDGMGLRLAREMAGRENGFEIHVSPLGRARQTAAYIRRSLALPMKEEPRLMEVTTGSWDGMTLYEIDMEYPGVLAGSTAFDWYFRSPDGETFAQACRRIEGWLSSLSTPVVAISHGLTGRLIRGIHCGLPEREMLALPVPQTGFYRLQQGKEDFIC